MADVDREDEEPVSSVADPNDRASLEEQAYLREMRQKQQDKMKPPPKGWDGVSCVEDCGDEVEPERIAIGLYRCFRCQTLLERKEKYAKR